MSTAITNHKVVSNDEWTAARKALLAKEKAFTLQRDEISRLRRELPRRFALARLKTVA